MPHRLALPNDVEQNVLAVIQNIADELRDWDEVIAVHVDPIEYKARDGFFPYTNGGYSGVASIPFRYGRFDYDCLSEYHDRDTEDMYAAFRRDKGDPEEYDDLSNEEFFDKFYEDGGAEFRSEWEMNNGDVFFLMFRAIFFDVSNRRNVSGEPEVYFFAGVNVDFNYGRDSIPWAGKSTFIHEYERNIPLSGLTTDLCDQIEKEIIQHFKEA